MEPEQLDQVAMLNQRVCTRLAPSKVHGVGVFAIRDLPKGTKVFADLMPQLYSLRYENFEKLNKEVREIILERFPTVVVGSRFGYPDTRVMAYMNHSDTPNYDPQLDLTIEDIKAGDEITEDYTQIPGADKVFPFLEKTNKKKGKV
jgi:SET domain-containing protein